MKLFNALSNMLHAAPIIPVKLTQGGEPVGKASLRGMSFALIGLVGLALMIYFWLLKDWCRQHPILAKVILGILAVWIIWFVIRWIFSFGDDPLLRREPYRKINLNEEDLKQGNPLNEPDSRKMEKDETHS